jgi:uncharacterized membrane protein YfcA
MEFAFNPWLAFGWSIFAGFLMAMGAGGGGILAGIGHISILGIGDPNMIKAVNQILELTSRLFSVPLYLRQKRLVWSLAISFAVGAPLGAISGSWISKTYLSDMASYRLVFGVLVILVAARTLYEALLKPKQRSQRLQKAFDISERVQSQRSAHPDVPASVPRVTRYGIMRTQLVFGNESFEFNPLAAAAGGFAISFVGSMMGVGGGFLVTPFMASILLFPMFFVVGTALVALMVPLTASVFTYILLSVDIDWSLVAVEVPGIIIGSIIGPMINQRVNERILRLFVAFVLIGIGIYYLA